MVPENLTPLEELRQLGQQIERATTLSELQPHFARLEEISRQHSGDFEVQIVAHDIKQQILAKGSELRRTQPRPVIPTPPLEAPLAKEAPHETPPAKPEPNKVAAEEPPRRKHGVAIAWVLAGLLLFAGVGIAISVMKDRDARLVAETPIAANIATVPPGAQILIDGQASCTSDCVARLLPGTYRVDATLEGYDPSTSQLKIVAEQPAELKLTLTPVSPGLRVIAEMRTGEIFLDDERVGELQDGEFTIVRVMPGKHTVRISGEANQATFTFDAAPGVLPAIDGPIATKELLAAIVASNATSAKLTTSSGPFKLLTNGEEEADATTEGVELTEYRVGANEFTLTDANKKKRTLSETFSATPMLTVFLKTDQNIGTLLISTGGESGVRVFVNNRETRKPTEKGELRVQAIGKVNVRVEKAGFDAVPPQTVTIAKGEEKKLEFTLKETPKFGTLAIAGGTPGAEVVLNQRVIGNIATDGTFRNASIAPGDHTIDLRADQHEPKRFTRAFRAGQIVMLTAAEAALATVRIAAPPPPPPPPPIATPPPAPKPAPRRVEGGMSDFDNSSAWRLQDGIHRHRGNANLTYSLTPNGIFTFSIYALKGGRVRWFLNYTDSKNYALFELDDKTFWAKTVKDGKTVERKKLAHKQPKDSVWNIQVDANPQRTVHKIQDNSGWVELDAWQEDLTNGKFGIQVQGNDEVGLSSFQFTGR